MGKTTVFTSGVHRVGYFMNKDEQIEEYQMLLMIPGLKLYIEVDETIRPVAQPAKKFPIPLEADVDGKIQEFSLHNIIEIVADQPIWVSPLSPVWKSDEDTVLSRPTPDE